MTGPVDNKIVLWCITDNKPGHKNQLRGLAKSLKKRTALDVHFIDVPATTSLVQKVKSFVSWLLRHVHFDPSLPRPDWVAACGHSTHLSLLAASRKYNAKSILLMKPTLPSSWFDLCFVPEHDEPASAENVIPTRGVLNVIEPSSEISNSEERISLVLIGGPSTHHDWDEQALLQQVKLIREKQTDKKIVLTTSRRTPKSTEEILAGLEDDFLSIIPVDQTDANWIPEHLARADEVFVTEDSVSMIYEAITSGASVTIMNVPRKNSNAPSRVIKGVDQLINDQFVLEFEKWESGHQRSGKIPKLHEADRCADVVIERFLK